MAKRIIYRMWFPKNGDWIKWRILRIYMFPICIFLILYPRTEKQNLLILVFFIFPFLSSAVARIREAQTCPIDDEREKISKIKYKSNKIPGIIGLFLPLLSICVVYFSYKVFWIVLGLSILFAVQLMLLNSITDKKFLILSVIYFVLYLIFLSLFMKGIYIFFYLFFALNMLPSSISQTIQKKRIHLELQQNCPTKS